MAMFESLIGLRDLGIGSGEFFAAEVQNTHWQKSNFCPKIAKKKLKKRKEKISTKLNVKISQFDPSPINGQKFEFCSSVQIIYVDNIVKTN